MNYSRLPGLLVLVGVVLMSISGTHWYLRGKALSFDQELVNTYQASLADARVETGSTRPAEPSHIKIKWFVDVSVETEVFLDGQWTISPDKASFLAQSARPGEHGNIIIYGHNTRQILGNIRALTGSEIITITTTDGVDHRYKIESIHQVSPSQIGFLEPTATETLTIYTCSGLLDSQRFIVRAVPEITADQI